MDAHMNEPCPRRRWWHSLRVRLKLRMLMACVLALACMLGFVVRRAHIQRDAVAAIERAGGRVRYDWQFQDGRIVSKGRIWWPKWLVDQLGLDYFSNVTMVDFPDRGSDAEMVALGQLSRVDTLVLNHASVTGDGFAHLDGMTSLRWLTLTPTGGLTGPRIIPLRTLTRLQGLNLDRTDVTDAGLRRLAGLSGLELLGLTGTKVTDSGLKNLEGLASLESLYLDGTQVSDEGLVSLKRLGKLKRLTLKGTKVTPSGASEFRQARPKVKLRG
jgi:hypothetical protein